MFLNDFLNELSLTLVAHADQPRVMARTLLAHNMGIDPAAILALKAGTELDPAVVATVRAQALRLSSGEPLAYVLGESWFYGHLFHVGTGVLIPRPDTEVLVEEAVAACARIEQPRILELCTGSACISISVLLELDEQDKTAQAVATDVSEAALSFAFINRDRYKLNDRLDLRLTDLFPAEEATFDLLLANPPYIDADDMAALDESVHAYEPHLALAGGADGLDFYRRIYTEATRYLHRGSLIICEHGYRQAEAISAIIQDVACYDQIELRRDYANRARVTICRYMPTKLD